MKRGILVLALLTIGCSGPIPLRQAIWPEHEREYAAALAGSAGNPREAWYAFRAAEEGTTEEAVESADLALSTTQNPFNARTSPEAVSRGAVIFENNCASCHGGDLRGDGPAMSPAHPTNDFHAFDKRFAATLHGGAPRAWFDKISNGYGPMTAYPSGVTRAMPAFGDVLSREQIWYAITYLQSLDMYAQPKNNS